MLHAYVSNTQIIWDMHLSLLEFAYNNRPHKVTSLSPFEMNYGMNLTFSSTMRLDEKCPTTAQFLTNIQA